MSSRKKEAARLAAYAPSAAAARRGPYRLVSMASVGLVVGTAVAGYHSESVGVSMSYVAALALGVGVGGWIGAGRSRVGGLLGSFAGGLSSIVALAVFYAAIWPSL